MAFQALENSLLLAVLLGIPHICAFEIPDVCSCECFVDGSLVHTKNGNNSYAVPSCHLCLSGGFCETQLSEHCKEPASIVAKCYERDALWNSIVPTGFILLVSFLLVVGLCSDKVPMFAQLTETGRLAAQAQSKLDKTKKRYQGWEKSRTPRDGGGARSSDAQL